MARSVVIEVVTDTRQAERGFNRLSGSASRAERDLNHTFRGVVSGSGVLRGLGRSLAFASTGFLAFATVSGSLRTSIDAATEAAATQRQLGAQFKAAGLQLRDYQGAIEDTSNRLSRLSGFTRDALEQSFLFAFRGTRNVAQALKIEAAAADVARGRHVGLQQATLAVTKGVTQNATALKRLGIAIPANIKGYQVLTFVQQRFAGQARAGTTAQDRLGASLHNLAESAGTALLPTINRVATRLAAWASNTRNQQRLQTDLTATLGAVKGAADAVAGAFSIADRVTGSWKHTLELLLALGAASKLRQIAISLGLLGTAAAGGAGGGGRRGGGGRGPIIGTPALVIGGLLAPLAFRAGEAAARAVGLGRRGGGGGSAARPDVHNLRLLNDPSVTWTFGGDGTIYAFKNGRMLGAIPVGAPDYALYAGRAKLSQARQRALARQGAASQARVRAGAPPPGAANATPAFFKQLIVPYRLRLEAARAAVTSTLTDDVKAALDEKKWLTALIASGRLRGKALLAAYAELANLNSTIASAQTNAAKKASDAAKRAAAEAKQRLADAKSAFTDASSSLKDTFKSATDQVQGIIGDLFAGPVLAPTADQIKRRLGVRIAGSTIGGLTSDVQGQTAQAAAFFKDLARIRKRGGPQSLIDQLMQAGLADASFAHTIAGSSRGDFRGLVGAVKARDRLAGKVALTTTEVRMAARNVRIDAAHLVAAGGQPQTINLVVDGQVLAQFVDGKQARHGRRNPHRRGGRH